MENSYPSGWSRSFTCVHSMMRPVRIMEDQCNGVRQHFTLVHCTANKKAEVAHIGGA